MKNDNDMFLLPTKQGYTTVNIFDKNSKLEEGIGYIYEGKVYIYKGKVSSENEMTIPGLYTFGNEIVFMDTHDNKPDNINIYDINLIKDMSPSAILKTIMSEPDNFKSEADLEEILVDRDTYVPLIKQTDDFLKAGIKRAIIGKKVNIKKRYKDEFESPSRLANMISALNGVSKMSTTYWTDWINMLGLGWEIRIYDKGVDDRNPLEDDIVLSSDDF